MGIGIGNTTGGDALRSELGMLSANCKGQGLCHFRKFLGSFVMKCLSDSHLNKMSNWFQKFFF